MDFDYDGLWNILIEQKMRKDDLRVAGGMSSATLAKLVRIK